MTGLTIISIILCCLLMLVCVYVVVLIRPSAKPPKNSTLLCEYAHRGLHQDGIPENSLSAFALACEKGFAIELDVHLSKDNEVMVFHDDTLERMTGDPAKISDLTCDELSVLTLSDTNERIPTFKQVLDLVDGRVPLLIELKGESTDVSLCAMVANILKDYSGEYCIESFNPLLLAAMRKQMPDAYYGLLYTNVCRDKQKCSVINIALTCMALNFIAKPNFIAFNQKDRNAFPVLLTTRIFGAQKYVWTVRSDEELKVARQNGECPIFEHCNKDK